MIEDLEVSRVNPALCKGCGTCVAACPSGVIEGQHYTYDAIMSQIEGILWDKQPAAGPPVIYAEPVGADK